VRLKPVSVGLVAAVVVVLDEILKYFALIRLPEEGSLIGNKIFAVGLHKNFGIAFNMPMNMTLVIVLTILLGIVFGLIIHRTYKTAPRIASGSILVLAGALGNLFDRIIYGFTVDYLIFFTRSAINLSDVLIVIGIVWLIFGNKKMKV